MISSGLSDLGYELGSTGGTKVQSDLIDVPSSETIHTKWLDNDVAGRFLIGYQRQGNGIKLAPSVLVHVVSVEKVRAEFRGLSYDPLIPTLSRQLVIFPSTAGKIDLYNIFAEGISDQSLKEQFHHNLEFWNRQGIPWFERSSSLERILAHKFTDGVAREDALPIAFLLSGRFGDARSSAEEGTRFLHVTEAVRKKVLEYCEKRKVPCLPQGGQP